MRARLAVIALCSVAPVAIARGVSPAAAAAWMDEWVVVSLPHVEGRSVYHSMIDASPVAVTISAMGQSVPTMTTRDAIRRDVTLWRRMHLSDWNALEPVLRREGLIAMLSRHHRLLMNPSRWSRMTAFDWDQVPQPVRIVAYRRMIDHWRDFYDVGGEHRLPPDLVGDTLAALVMSESWWEHRAENLGWNGLPDVGLAQASEGTRARMRDLHRRGEVDVLLTDADYFDPWMATRFVAIWMKRLLAELGGDLDLATRAYHRGVGRAMDERGTAYLETVHHRLRRFIRRENSPAAWNDLWNSAARLTSGQPI